MPPAMMTSVMPSATQALIEDCCRMLRIFCSVRKLGVRIENTTTITSRPNTVPASRMPTGKASFFGVGRAGL